ncbi:MAG: HDOD domain-containing protein [Planctomycetota bacterium]
MKPTPRLLEKIEELPTLPDVVARVNQLVNSESATAGHVNAVISRDMALSAKVLRMANSSFYGFSRRITSITHAVVILGFKTIRNLALSAFVFNAFKRKTPAFDVRAFWIHSLGVAVTAAAASEELGFSIHDREDVFIGGLLHGVGKVAMSEYMPEDLEAVCRMMKEKDLSFAEAERVVHEFDYAELSGALLDKWSLPPGLIAVVRHHLDPARAGEHERTASLVHLSDILSRALLFGCAGEDRVTPISPEAWATLRLDRDILGRIMDRSLVEFERASAFLDIL